MVASGYQKSSAALDFGFELLNSGEQLRATLALLLILQLCRTTHSSLPIFLVDRSGFDIEWQASYSSAQF